MLEIRDLRVYYKTSSGPVRAVDGVNLTVKPNEIIGITGESGCGKSTLASAIMKLIRLPCYIESGELNLDGVNLLSLEEKSLRRVRWKDISIIPQSAMNALNPVMRIEDQITDVIRAHESITKEEAEERVAEAIKKVDLPLGVTRMYPHELSGGMKQRAVIAMAIVLEPKLIIADEVTTALDVVVQRIVLDIMMDLRKKLGLSIIFITHSMAVQAEISDRLAIMYAGKVVEIGDIHDIFRTPLHPYTKALIRSIPYLKEKKTLTGLYGRPPSLLNPPEGCRFHPRCPLAVEKCKKEEPPICKKSGRLVACHQV